MRIIRKPVPDREERKIRSGFAAGVKKGEENMMPIIEALHKERTKLQEEVTALRNEISSLRVLEWQRLNEDMQKNPYTNPFTGDRVIYKGNTRYDQITSGNVEYSTCTGSTF